MSYNPGLLFYKHYYEGIRFGSSEERIEKDNEKKFQARNQLLLETRLKNNLLPPLSTPMGSGEFSLTTTYPGLILGTGYTHGSGLMGEFKTGFYFDHTTGLPAIPGSSIKGLLRSAFPSLYYEKAEKSDKVWDAETAQFWRKLGDNRTRFLEALIQALGYKLDGAPDAIRRMEREIFEGLHGADREKKEDHFRMSDRDIFYDAMISGPTDGLLLSDEYITPHKNPLKNPIPIQILKVRPGVAFTFRFNLKATYQTSGLAGKVPRLLTPSQRLELFRQILMFLGAGAKTNTGFGHFEPKDQVDLVKGGKTSAQPSTESTGQTPVKKEEAAQQSLSGLQNYTGKIKANESLTGEVVSNAKPLGTVKIMVNGVAYTVKASGNLPEPGRIVRLKINSVDAKHNLITQVGLIGLI